MPRRAARLKIPAQAFGDKEYFSGASGSKICDKEHAPAPLCCSEILGVVHAPCEINASASYHTGIGPPSRIRHWNFGRCERLQHSFKVTSSCGRQSAGYVFPQRDLGVFAMCHLLHFTDNPDCLRKEAASCVRKAQSLACHRKPLAGGTKREDVHRGKFPPIQPCNVPDVFHIWKVTPGDLDGRGQDFTGPNRGYPIKRGGIGKAPYPVKQRT